MKKQPEITAQTRENLMAAFWSLYCQEKMDLISVKAITDKAGYHRSTFYEYFVDIYDLLNQLEESLLADLKEKALKSIKDEQNEDVIKELADVYESKAKYLSVLLGENGDPNFSKKLKGIMRPMLKDTFGMSESDSHTYYIFEFGFSAILSTITFWYQSNKNLPASELVFLIRSMLMNGIFPMVQRYSILSPNL